MRRAIALEVVHEQDRFLSRLHPDWAPATAANRLHVGDLLVTKANKKKGNTIAKACHDGIDFIHFILGKIPGVRSSTIATSPIASCSYKDSISTERRSRSIEQILLYTPYKLICDDCRGTQIQF